jgi:Replication-relaxation
MFARMDARTRNSRWDREPKRNKIGEPIVARLTEDDIAIFDLLGRYRYLPSDHLAALTGRSLPALQARLEILCRKPNCYINRPHQQRDNADANARRLIYELDDKGGEELRRRGIPYSRKKYLRNFAHELMACTVAASFEIGAKTNPNIRIVRWHQVIDSPQMPAATKQLSNPQAIPFDRDGKREEIECDWRPFVIERNFQSKSYIFVFGFEADCGTEPIDTADSERSAIRNKFAAYLTALEQDVPRRHFGATTFMVPFITTTEARRRSMIALLDRLQAGPLAKRFLFKHIPAFTSFEKPAPATGHMLNEPWHRAGFEPFRFTE